MAERTKKSMPIPYLALFLAWIVPGAGHVYLGRVGRGVIIFLVITGTFWAGIAMGGVLTVDYQNERWWFIAEMFTGIHGLVGWQRQSRVYEAFRQDRQVQQAAREGWLSDTIDQKLAESGLALVYPVDTVARAYAGVAGLLNLMCIFDAVMLALMGVSGEPGPEPAPPKRKAQSR